MGMVLVFLYALFSVGGLYFLSTTGIWYYKSVATRAEILGFQKKKDKGRALPVVSFKDRDDVAVKAGIRSIDHVGFLISGADKDREIPIRYHKENPKIAKISGLFSFIIGGVLQVPLVTFLVNQYGDGGAQIQLSFLFTLLVIFGGAWLFLRLIRLSY